MIATIGHGWVRTSPQHDEERRWCCTRCNALRRQRVGVTWTEQSADRGRSWHRSLPCVVLASLPSVAA